MNSGRSVDAGERSGATDAGSPAITDADAVPPGPDGYPIVGSTLEIVREPFDFLEELSTYGDVVRYRIVGDTITALFHPEDVQRVLVEDADRFERYLFADRGHDFAPEGILFTRGEQWRVQRQVVQPAFTRERIQTYAETMSGAATALTETWCDGEMISVNRAFSNLTLRILSSALFDVEVDPTGEDEAIVRAARVINEQNGSRSFAAFVPEWVPTPGNRRYRRALSAYRDRLDDLIEHRRASGERGDDLLSILLQTAGPEGERLSESEVRDNLLTFTFAGHETTSLALTYTFLLLARHEDVRQRLDAEHECVLDGAVPTVEDVPALEYTERVITEAMRLYPPAYMIFRKATADTTVGGYGIPEGTIVSLPQYRIHRDERFYDEPESFRPERWTDEFERDLPTYAYFPFGGGPRHCLGMRFAMLELVLVVSTIAQRVRFDVQSDHDPTLAAGATLQPRDDVRLRIRKRN